MDQYYADDSVNNNCIGYLAVGISASNISPFLSIYKKIKIHFNMSPELNVHSKFFFNEISRKKDEKIKHLSDIDCFNFFLKTYGYYKQYCLQPILSTADKRDFPSVKKKMEFEDLILDEKQIINILKSAVMIEIFNRHEQSEDKYEFYADKVDRNDKISSNATPLAGVRRRYMMPSTLLDPNITGRNDHIRLKDKKYQEAPHKEIYEIADMCAYISTRALSIQQFKNKNLYKNIYEFMELCHRPLTNSAISY